MNKDHTKNIALWAALDLIAAVAAMAFAYWVRFVLLPGRNPVGGFRYHMLWVTVYAPVYVILYGILGVYTPHPQKGFIHDFGRIILGNTIGVMGYIDLIFVFRVVDFSRWMIWIFYLTLNLLTMLRGFAAHRWLRSRYRRGIGLRRLVIVGDGPAAKDCLDRISRQRDAGFVPAGTVGDRAVEGAPLLGGYDELRSVLDAAAPDELILALEENQAERLGDMLRSCEDTGVELTLLPMCYGNLSARPYMEELAGLPLINIRRVKLDDTAADLAKRVMDVVGSALLIVLTSPVMLLAAVGTRLSSPGPVIFRQERIGRDRKPFYMLKFRSMRMNEDSDSAWTRDGNPRPSCAGTPSTSCPSFSTC